MGSTDGRRGDEANVRTYKRRAAYHHRNGLVGTSLSLAHESLELGKRCSEVMLFRLLLARQLTTDKTQTEAIMVTTIVRHGQWIKLDRRGRPTGGARDAETS